MARRQHPLHRSRRGEMRIARPGGFRWVRNGLRVESTSASRSLRFAGTTGHAGASRRLKPPDPIIRYSNRHTTTVSRHTADAGLAAFARWAAASVRHFRGRGIVWEMLQRTEHSFWKANAERVGLREAGARGRQASAPPRPTSSTGRSRHFRFDYDFLEACFKPDCCATGTRSPFTLIAARYRKPRQDD